MMKRKYYILPFICLLIASCEGYFDQMPRTELPADKVYESYDGALRNVVVLYARLGNMDNGLNSGARFEMPSIINVGPFDLNSSSSVPREIWSRHYSFIAQANLILENLSAHRDDIDNTYASSAYDNFASDIKPSSRLEAETRFLRAYAYFNLYRYFGGVPLITSPTGPTPEYVPRSDRESMFRFLYDELDFALENSVDNNSGIAYGRVTKGAAAALLAKVKVFHASYIRRAETVGEKIGEAPESSFTKEALYKEAIDLCNDIIGDQYGTYDLMDYYPAVFTRQNDEIILSAMAEEGQGTGNSIPIGFPGPGKNGASGGKDLTSWLTLLYDIPMWEHGYSLRSVSYDYGQIDRFNETTPKPGTTSNELRNLYETTGEYTVTGDTTRRMWTSVKGYVTGSADNDPDGLWVFEPAGRYLGPEFYIEPGKVNDYTDDQLKIFDRVLEAHERTWWMNETNGLDKPDLWNVNWWRLGKFRNPNPNELSSTFEIEYGAVDYPLLRLAEIYLLRAEAQIMSGQTLEGIRSINTIRDRACNQSTARDMFLNQGDAAYSYIAGSVEPVPETITGEQALKELLYERLRELAGEDDCGWLDLARYPDILVEDMNDVCRYHDPLQGLAFFGDPARNEYMWDMFDAGDLVYKVLMPIPYTELTFYPEMKQNPGYL